jgi:quinol monooxygenase YgiN
VITEYIRYTIPINLQPDFVRDYVAAKEPLLRSPHALNFEISRCSDDDSKFIVRIEWTSAEDHLVKFRNSNEFQDFFQRIKPYVGMIDEMRHYAVL